ncbi:unnamed protein product [Phyllotreta striolata]|uniref:VWFA domain-containing protein n=1 Tax=Phyllotreta striolata TaxID=444603 RepID=A0A9N9TQ42_PHYSR|nr:unnamed protein product [Phyllotreta striolata]
MTDYTRHLDEITREARRLSTEIIHDALLEGNFEHVLKIMQHWEGYQRISDTPNKLMDQEMQLFLRKISKQTEILQLIRTDDNETVINKLEERLQSIHKSVKTHSSINAGGTFEWVDSVLIQCLRTGSWLLIDNVNLCSSAVLDRLNALLEPGGVLAVTERGVDADGDVVQVAPHQDFRLFLTMDPKNGEISRAMRNRGVEIYVLNDNELESSNKFDRISLVELEGLSSPYTELTVDLHDAVSQLIIGEKPTVNELVQLATLLAQKFNHAVDKTEALLDTLTEVYYKSRSPGEFACADFAAAMRAHIASPAVVELAQRFLSMRTREISRDASMEQTRQRSVLLFDRLQGDDLAGIDASLLHLLVSFYSSASPEDLRLRHAFVREKIAMDASGDFKEALVLISDRFFGCIGGFECDQGLPVDKNWISSRVLDDAMSNRVNLGLYALVHQARVQLELHSKSGGNLDFRGVSKPPKGKNITLMEYARLVQQRKVEDKFNDVVVRSYADLHDKFDSYLLGVSSKISELSDDGLVEVFYAIFWRYKFFCCFTGKINDEDVRDVVNNLSVHYKWFYKYSLKNLTSLTKVPIDGDLERILVDINSKLDRQFSTMYKLAKNYHKSSDPPPPFTTKEQLENSKSAYDLISLYDTTRKGIDPIAALNAFNDNRRLRSALLELKSAENVPELLEECKRIDGGESLSKFQLQLVPIFDVFARLEIKTALFTNDSIDNNSIPINLAAVLRVFRETNDDRLLHEIYKCYYNYLMNSPSVRPGAFLGDDKNAELNEINPKLTYLLTGLLSDVGEENFRKITLENFRDLSTQYRSMHSILWRNVYQLSERRYSFVRIEKANVSAIYNKFLTNFSDSLKIDTRIHQFPIELTTAIIETLQSLETSPTFVDPRREIHRLAHSLLRCSEIHAKLTASGETTVACIELISELYMRIGGAKAAFHGKLPAVDPLMKKSIKRNYCREARDDFALAKTCYENLNRICGCDETTSHPYCIPLERMMGKLDRKRSDLSKYVAYRPKDVSYQSVFQVINHAFSTIMSEDLLEDERTNANYLEKLTNKVPSYENFIHELSQFSASYPDIVEPLLGSASEFLYGLKLRLSCSKFTAEKIDSDRARFVNCLIGFPVINETCESYESYVELLCSKGVERFIGEVLDDSERPYVKEQESFRMLKVAIRESFNSAVANSKINDNLLTSDFEIFDGLINRFVESYNAQQEQNEKKKEESESLYKIKTKLDEKSDEEKLQEDLQKLFSNHHDADFSDFQRTSEPIPIDDSSTVNYQEVISFEDLKEVVLLHTGLLRNLTRCEWLNPRAAALEADHLRPLAEKFETFSKILGKIIAGVSWTLDEESTGSLNIMLNVKRNYEQAGVASNDFYNGSNVEEVKSCYHILEELKVKINELLEEWPDQPTLKTIITVIERIYTFEITSPISRFLTGFEILLSKCHEWEEVAHSGVSLSLHYQSLTAQIVHWRKLELSMWKKLLHRVHDRLNESLPKWWLHLFNTLHQFVYSKRLGEKELIETLQTFIAKSSLAEFHGRLDLLYVFHCHAVILNRNVNCEAFINVLWNTFVYFRQFAKNIDRGIEDSRKPVEKKLKDYIKIVRWKDVNYFAIKDTVEKSHKMLHKYMKEYQEKLEQPVMPYLHNVINPENASNAKGITEIDSTHYLNELEKHKANLADLKLNVKNKFLHCTEIFTDILKSSSYGNNVKKLNNFISNIIETSTHLQQLEVDTTLERKKQKSQAKHILQQKHRALADLFKALSKMGLSYRTGLVETKTKDLTADFLLKPVDLRANCDYHSYRSEEYKRTLIELWESAETYYVKSLMRFDVLSTALNSPSKDLGMHNVERCKGFGFHLLTLVQKQKVDLTEASRAYFKIKTHQNQLKTFLEGSDYIPLELTDEIVSLLTKLTVIVDQYRMVLNACPEDDALNEDISGVPVLKSEVECRITRRNDELWIKTTNLLNTMRKKADIIAKDLIKSKADVPSLAPSTLTNRYVSVKHSNELIDDLQDLIEDSKVIRGIFNNIKLTASLAYIEKEIDSKQRLIKESKHQLAPLKIDDLKTQFKSFTRAVSSLTKKLKERAKEDQKQPDEEEESEEVIEEHIKKHLVENISDDLKRLNLNRLVAVTETAIEFLLKTNPEATTEIKPIAKQFLPLLEQLTLILGYYIAQLASSYRATSKLCSILLNIFIELASKGFCIPPEFSEEFDEEGISKPSDGMGLGEGQGERDVSDKIESEDQLDDAQPAGQEKDKGDDKDCKEEEKGIEMSDDFDSKLQDKEKNDDDDDESESSGDSDAEEQMGETDKGAEQSNKETFGDDQELEEDGPDSEDKDEKGNGGEKAGEDQLGASEEQSEKEKNDDEDPTDGKEKNHKEINEMEEPEYDDNQIDPHHGNQPELPEPEPMDLPDDVQLDDGDPNDENDQNQEENPFDIDTMKSDNAPDEKEEDTPEENPDERAKDDERNFSSDDEDVEKGENQDEHLEEDAARKEKSNEKDEEADDESDVASEIGSESGLDNTQSNQDNIEAMDVDESEAADKAQASKSNQQSNQSTEEVQQEDKPDQEGVGQAQMEESRSGHAAQTSAPQETKTAKDNAEEERKRRRKPGESDSKRSLGDADQPAKKKLKTVDTEANNDGDNVDDEAEEYQHIREAEKTKTQVLDVATKEQAESQRKELRHDEENADEEDETLEASKDVPSDEEQDIEQIIDNTVEPEKTGESLEKRKTKQQHPDGDITEDLQDVRIDGEIVDTQTVARNTETTHHTQYASFKDKTAARLSAEELNDLRTQVETQLAGWNDPPSTSEADRAWQKISSITSSLAQDLSEQLRLVLEPTQATRLKGDYRTGRRINMRKVIPYIASQFRKDKIWLRRTKPSKRDYQIVLAIDDSSSMSDNRSKELAFESVALLSKALTLLEAGQLGVLSFGEKVEIIHKLAEPFTDRSGVKLLQRFQFDENKTAVGRLVDFAVEMFEQGGGGGGGGAARLLVIVGDGRGVFSEGEELVRGAARRARLAGVFVVFVIVDSADGGGSILDIRMPVFEGGRLREIRNYVDEFPFSFYIILREIKSLPSVLSDALRQWFEMLSNVDT